MEAFFAMAMGIEDLGYIVSGGESGKGRVFFQNVGRRIVQEQEKQREIDLYIDPLIEETKNEGGWEEERTPLLIR